MLEGLTGRGRVELKYGLIWPSYLDIGAVRIGDSHRVLRSENLRIVRISFPERNLCDHTSQGYGLRSISLISYPTNLNAVTFAASASVWCLDLARRQIVGGSRGRAASEFWILMLMLMLYAVPFFNLTFDRSNSELLCTALQPNCRTKNKTCYELTSTSKSSFRSATWPPPNHVNCEMCEQTDGSHRPPFPR